MPYRNGASKETCLYVTICCFYSLPGVFSQTWALGLVYLVPQCNPLTPFAGAPRVPERFSKRLLSFGYAYFREDLVRRPLALDILI